MKTEINGKFEFEKDTRKFHRFKVISDEGSVQFNGSLYISKDGPGIPKRIILINPNAEE